MVNLSFNMPSFVFVHSVTSQNIVLLEKNVTGKQLKIINHLVLTAISVLENSLYSTSHCSRIDVS